MTAGTTSDNYLDPSFNRRGSKISGGSTTLEEGDDEGSMRSGGSNASTAVAAGQSATGETQGSVLCWFLGFTSIGGLSQYSSTDHRSSKVLWSIVFVTGFILTVFNVYTVAEDYLARLIVTTVTNEFADSLDFPAVTICNYNIVHCKNLYDHIAVLNESLQEEGGGGEDKDELATRMKILCAIHKLSSCNLAVWADEYFRLGKPGAAPVCQGSEYESEMDATLPMLDDAVVHEIFIRLIYQLSEADRYAISQRPEQLVKHCKFMNSDQPECEHLIAGATKILSPSQGACYSFNYRPPNPNGNLSVEEKVEKLVISNAGELYGLELELSLDSLLYVFNGLSPSLGVKLLVHETDQYPMVTSQGLALAPNMMYSVALEHRSFSRQPDPYPSKCRSEWDHRARLPTEGLLSALPYNENLCQSFCMDDVLQKKCACTVLTTIEVDRGLSPTCDSTNITHIECVFAILRDRTELTDTIPKACTYCGPRCSETQYSTTLSASEWPSSQYWPILSARHNLTFNGSGVEDMMDMNDDQLVENTVAGVTSGETQAIQTYIEKNYLKVRVFYNSKSSTTVVETPKYRGWDSVLSSLGGAISLFLGMSFVSLVELLELLVRSIISGAKRL